MGIIKRLGDARRAFADGLPNAPEEGEVAGHGSGAVASSYIGNVEAKIGTYSPETIGFATLRKMQRFPTIKACMSLSELALRFAQWDVDGSDPVVVEFTRSALERVWGQIVKSCARTGAYEGCAPHELVWARTDTHVLIEEKLDSSGAVVTEAVDQVVTGWTLKKVKDIDPESLQSILVNGLEDFRGYKLTYPNTILDAEKAFHYATGSRFGNYWGEGRLAAVYDEWYQHKIVQTLFMRFMARRTTPAVHVEFPEGVDSDGKSNADTAALIASGFQSDATSVWTQAGTGDPAMGGAPGWSIKLIEDAQRAQTAQAFLSGMKALQMQMMIGLLTPEKVLNGDGGSNALAESHSDIWMLGVEGTFGEIIEAVNDQIVPRLVRYTFGADTPVPRVVSAGMDSDRQAFLGTLFTELVKAGKVSVDADSIAERLGVPTKAGETDQTAGDSSAMSDNRSAAVRLARDLEDARLAFAAAL